MIYTWLDGTKLRIPKGYHETEEGVFINGHGVEYGVVEYGKGIYCLETIYSKYVRTVELEIVRGRENDKRSAETSGRKVRRAEHSSNQDEVKQGNGRRYIGVSGQLRQ